MDELLKLLHEIQPNVDFENESDLLESGLLDSFSVVMIIDSICQHYNIELSADDIDPDNFQSIQTIWDMVEKYILLKD